LDLRNERQGKTAGRNEVLNERVERRPVPKLENPSPITVESLRVLFFTGPMRIPAAIGDLKWRFL